MKFVDVRPAKKKSNKVSNRRVWREHDEVIFSSLVKDDHEHREQLKGLFRTCIEFTGDRYLAGEFVSKWIDMNTEWNEDDFTIYSHSCLEEILRIK